MFILLFILTYLGVSNATYVISIYGDVYNDKEFFTKTYPWIIDNIGGDITVDYYLLGRGKYSVPQMCVLNELRMNTFLQAQYLKCEAEGNRSERCLCEAGIDPYRYRQCVLTRGSLASYANMKYSQLALDISPILEIGPRNTIFEVSDTSYLKKICTIFGDDLPRGCVKPFGCNQTESVSTRRGVVNFDCKCAELDKDIYLPTTTYTTLTSPYSTTSTTTKMWID